MEVHAHVQPVLSSPISVPVRALPVRRGWGLADDVLVARPRRVLPSDFLQFRLGARDVLGHERGLAELGLVHLLRAVLLLQPPVIQRHEEQRVGGVALVGAVRNDVILWVG